ncbi:MAG: hypothetical protein MK194_03375 [Roseibacillus sp.]|nr:hypothetical protein [Roseibacillus sp.]
MANRLFATFLAVLGLAGGISSACTVPVFRYALDHWPADPYRLEAPAGWIEGESGAGLRKLLAESGMKLEVEDLVEAGASARLLMPGDGSVVWSGTLEGNAPALLISPARNALARRILAGESMVWVMVASGDEPADRKFEKSLKERLEYLQSVAAIPEQDPTDPESKLGPGPELRVGFSFLKVSRDDPEEQVFLRMLAGPGSDFLEKEEPFGAVVFGRGRVLGAWPADELDAEGIDEVSLFLLGACSCRVKFQNPGWDLALALDWDEALLAAQMALDNESGEPAPVRDESPQSQPEIVRIEGGNDPGAVGTDREGKNPKAHAGAGPVISVLVALTGVLALYCAFVGKGSAKGS